MERGWKPNIEVSPPCPRCGSSNTKFCYYNNYSLTQPRYFCKSCRRYWTKGGSLRNVPVGGGCRKTRRGRSSRAASSSRSSPHTNPIHESTSSTASTTIDLAAVYANFLNPPPPPSQPQVSGGIEIPPVEFSGLQMNQLGWYLPQDNGIFECGSFLGGGGNDSNLYSSGGGYGGANVLPPLPGEEAAGMTSEMLLPLGQEMEVEAAQQNLSTEANNTSFSGFNLEAIFRS